MENDKNINNIEKQIKELEKEKLEIKNNCLHKNQKVKFEEGKNIMRLYCEECNALLGFPTQEQINKFLNNDK